MIYWLRYVAPYLLVSGLLFGIADTLHFMSSMGALARMLDIAGVSFAVHAGRMIERRIARLHANRSTCL